MVFPGGGDVFPDSPPPPKIWLSLKLGYLLPRPHGPFLYLEHGFTYWDPLTYAPFGRPIFYPPLFQYLLAAAGVLFNQDILTVAGFSGRIFAFLVILSFTYTTYKLYNKCTAFFAGFHGHVHLTRPQVCSPYTENLALMIFPLSIYLYYRSIKDDSYRYAVLSGVLAGIIFLVHALSILILVLVI